MKNQVVLIFLSVIWVLMVFSGCAAQQQKSVSKVVQVQNNKVCQTRYCYCQKRPSSLLCRTKRRLN
jgi:protein involved in sex pheromone biosynthesis